ncbi:MAG: ACT domain-containing protein [Candidatus Aenigmarchaeota archaeon]|nr:ACT domain-containing protein [Candidatus Aenigmarchaeota archaeon]
MKTMRNFNIVKLDSKGRLLVPFHIRQHVGLDRNVELLIVNNGTKELRLFPLIPGKSARIDVVMKDAPGALASVMNIIAGSNIDILMSESKTVEKGKIASWSAIVDTTACSDIAKLKKNLKALGIVESAEVMKK